MWWKNAQWMIIYAVAGAFFIFFLAGCVCGFDFHRCKAK